MNFSLKQFLLPLGLLSLVFWPAHLCGYPFGYAILQQPVSQTRLDIVFDCHAPEIELTTDQIYDHAASLHKVKPLLFPTEARVLTTLENINKSGQSVDLIWEDVHRMTGTKSVFLCCAQLIKNTFTNVNFIHGDRFREWFGELFNVRNWDGSLLPKINAAGNFFEALPLLPDDKINKIIKNHGSAVCQNYKSYYEKKMKAVQDYFRPFYKNDSVLDVSQDLVGNIAFLEIANPEFLYNILASDKERIILYAGGFHGLTILPFLLSSGFRLKHFVLNRLAAVKDIFVASVDELFADNLSALDKELEKPRLAPAIEWFAELIEYPQGLQDQLKAQWWI